MPPPRLVVVLAASYPAGCIKQGGIRDRADRAPVRCIDRWREKRWRLRGNAEFIRRFCWHQAQALEIVVLVHTRQHSTADLRAC